MKINNNSFFRISFSDMVLALWGQIQPCVFRYSQFFTIHVFCWTCHRCHCCCRHVIYYTSKLLICVSYQSISMVNHFPHTSNMQMTTLKTLWQMKKLLIISNFSFCHIIFKTILLQMRQNVKESTIIVNPCLWKTVVQRQSVGLSYQRSRVRVP